MSPIEEADRREIARIQRQERRAKLLADAGHRCPHDDPDDEEQVAAPVDHQSAPAGITHVSAQPPVPAQLPVPARLGPGPNVPEIPDSSPAAELPFAIVDELPGRSRRDGNSVPAVRQDLVAFARQNPRHWIRYLPSALDPFKSSYTLASQVRAGQAGFGPGYEAVCRNKTLFIRYVGANALNHGGDQRAGRTSRIGDS